MSKRIFGISALSDLSDVALSNILDDHIFIRRGSSWVNEAASITPQVLGSPYMNITTLPEGAWHPLLAGTSSEANSFMALPRVNGNGYPRFIDVKGNLILYMDPNDYVNSTHNGALKFVESTTIQVITAADAAYKFNYMDSVIITEAEVVVSAVMRDTSGGADYTVLRFYTKTDGTWSVSQTLTAPGTVYSFAIPSLLQNTRFRVSNGYLYLTVPSATVGGVSNTGAIYVYKKGSSGWSLYTTITSPNTGELNYGSEYDVCDDTLMVVGDSGQKLYIYRSTDGITWALAQTFTPGELTGYPTTTFGYIKVSTKYGVVAPASSGNWSYMLALMKNGQYWFMEAQLPTTPNPLVTGQRLEVEIVGDYFFIGDPYWNKTWDGSLTTKLGRIWMIRRSPSAWFYNQIGVNAYIGNPNYGGDDYFGSFIKFDGTKLHVAHCPPGYSYSGAIDRVYTFPNLLRKCHYVNYSGNAGGLLPQVPNRVTVFKCTDNTPLLLENPCGVERVTIIKTTPSDVVIYADAYANHTPCKIGASTQGGKVSNVAGEDFAVLSLIGYNNNWYVQSAYGTWIFE